MSFESFEVSFRRLPRQICRVRVGAGVLDALVEDLERQPPGRRLIVVSDERVMPLYGRPLAERLGRRGLAVEAIAIPEGEASKTRETKAQLEDRLLDAGLGRDGALLAVGGGVTGDLVGFVAATWLRGIPVVQVPTSLLAMVDAALGGKTAVNLARGKNLVGSFHQPWGVYADVSALSTLDDQDYVDGFAEIVKSAAVADARLFSRLETSIDALLRRDGPLLEQVVARCLRIKARIVRGDEREAGPRAALNFGHTVGHAIEAASEYRERHGRAVAAGLCVEARLARESTGLPAAHAARIERLIRRLGLPAHPPPGVSADALVAATRRDKKMRSGEVRYALPARIGRMPAGDELTLALDEARLRQALSEQSADRID